MKRRTCRQEMIILSLTFLFVTVFVPNVFCAGWSGSYDFGVVQTGSKKCMSVSWTNDSGGETICDSNGCYQTPLPTRNVSFSASNDYSYLTISPSSSTVPGYGTVNLSVCTTPSVAGDYYDSLTATVSPAFDGGGTTDSTSVHLKALSTLVTAEPLGGSLIFDTTQVGNTESKYFNVCNYNTYSVTIASISINDSDFTVASGQNSTISPNGTCVPVWINFTPLP